MASLGGEAGPVAGAEPRALPRPRDLAVKRSPRFGGYVDQIWQLIEGEVLEGVRHGAGG